MRRIFVFSISFLLIVISRLTTINAQDTVQVPLKIRLGLEVSGPIMYLIDNNIYRTEASISADINTSYSAYLGGGYVNYKYTQYNYEYLSKGPFLRAGVDLNLLKPEKAKGLYYVGVGLRYGLSHFDSEAPAFHTENYWGVANSSVPAESDWAHFIELTPGVRAELFKNFSIGWNASLRMLLHTGASEHFRPIHIPGFGDSGTNFSTGLTYFIVWNIPYKKVTVITKKKEPEEEVEEVPDTGSGNTGQGSGIRQ